MKFDGTISGSEIFLKQMEASEINEVFISWLHDPETNKFLEVRHNLPDLQQQVDYVDSCISSPYKIYFGIYRLDSSLIGSSTVSLHSGDKIEVGLMVGDKSSRGKGYGREVVRLLVHWAKATGFQEVTAGYSTDNVASAKLFASLGFVINDKAIDGGIVREQKGVVRTSLSLRS
jgi:ribosomal-protein-alanine N-acetyltransferase